MDMQEDRDGSWRDCPLCILATSGAMMSEAFASTAIEHNTTSRALRDKYKMEFHAAGHPRSW